VEEPNALLTLGDGGTREPNIAATVAEVEDGLVARTQNAWPSVKFDLMAINNLLSPVFVAGFYYKTFMGPTRHAWMFYEHFIRKAAGLGASVDDFDVNRYDWHNVYHRCAGDRLGRCRFDRRAKPLRALVPMCCWWNKILRWAVHCWVTRLTAPPRTGATRCWRRLLATGRAYPADPRRPHSALLRRQYGGCGGAQRARAWPMPQYGVPRQRHAHGARPERS
jgi:hypothetical protein